MSDFLKTLGLSPEQISRIREIQNRMGEASPEGRSIAERVGCFDAQMQAKHPEIYQQYQAEKLTNPVPSSFMSRLPIEDQRIGNQQIADLFNMRQRLPQLAERAATELGYGNEQIQGRSIASFAVQDITQPAEACSLSSAPSQTNGVHTRVAQTRPRGPGMGA